MNKKENNIIELDSLEHIRFRPQMYLGKLDTQSLLILFKSVLTYYTYTLKSNNCSICFLENKKGRITIQNINSPIIDIWSNFRQNNIPDPHKINLQVLNALSKDFEILIFDSSKKLVCNQKYIEGKLSKGEVFNNQLVGSTIEVLFTLDSSIWQESGYWNETYIIRDFLEFSFLHKTQTFNIQTTNNTLNLKSGFGLKELVNVELKDNFSTLFLENEIQESNSKFEIEIYFAFNRYSKDFDFKKSFVNDYCTRLHGSHVKGVALGIQKSLYNIIEHTNYQKKVKIPKSKILKNLILAVNIRIDKPIFYGATKDKLVQKELINDVAKIVMKHFLPKLESNRDSAITLIKSYDENYTG